MKALNQADASFYHLDMVKKEMKNLGIHKNGISQSLFFLAFKDKIPEEFFDN